MAIDCLILGPAYPYRGGIADTNHAFAKELIKQGETTEIWTFTKLYPNIIFPGKTQFDLADKKFSFASSALSKVKTFEQAIELKVPQGPKKPMRSCLCKALDEAKIAA